MRLSALPLVALPLVLAACGSSAGTASLEGPSSPSSAPVVSVPVTQAAGPARCDVVLADGVHVESTKTMSSLCVNEKGENHAYGTATKVCVDGRTLAWNDRGWAYIGDNFHAGRSTPPADVTAACKG